MTDFIREAITEKAKKLCEKEIKEATRTYGTDLQDQLYTVRQQMKSIRAELSTFMEDLEEKFVEQEAKIRAYVEEMEAKINGVLED